MHICINLHTDLHMNIYNLSRCIMSVHVFMCVLGGGRGGCFNIMDVCLMSEESEGVL